MKKIIKKWDEIPKSKSSNEDLNFQTQCYALQIVWIPRDIK